MKKYLEEKIISFIGNDRFLSMQIDITNFCNLSCSHCYHTNHKNDGAITLSDWFKILDQYDGLIKKLNLRGHIIICGGEPLSSQLFYPILDKIKRISTKYHVTVLTNGTLIHRLNFDLLKDFEKIDFQISLDGPNSEIHDSFRGEGSFIKALEGIRKIKENKLSVYLQATLSRKNGSAIKDFFNLAKELNADAMNFTRLIEVGTGELLIQSNNDQPLLGYELKNVFEEILIQSARSGIKTDTEIPLMNLIHPALGRKYSFAEGLVIDYQGYLLVSSRSRVRISKVTEENLEKVFFENKEKKFFLNKDNYECSSCPHFNSCGGDLNVAYAASGSFFKKDPGCWYKNETA